MTSWIEIEARAKTASRVDFPAPPSPTHNTANSGLGGGGERQQQEQSLQQHCRDGRGKYMCERVRVCICTVHKTGS